MIASIDHNLVGLAVLLVVGAVLVGLNFSGWFDK